MSETFIVRIGLPTGGGHKPVVSLLWKEKGVGVLREGGGGGGGGCEREGRWVSN